MDATVLLLAAEEDEDEVLLLCLLADEERRQERRQTNYAGLKWRFDFEATQNEECLDMFRFEKQDIVRLCTALHIPGQFRCYNGTICTGIDALCILLRRLAYPNRLVDLVNVFGRRKEEISMIFNHVLSFVFDHFNHLLTSFNQPWMSPENLRRFADAIHQKGAPLVNCWGFIDGTLRPICRPGMWQKEVYSGHKRVHALKYQSIMVPNGLVANMFGPFEGRRHDAAMLAESDIMPHLQNLRDNHGEKLCIYGDPAYPLSPELLSPFRGAQITAAEKTFNKEMSKVRESVEWGFGNIISLFAFLDYKKNQKLFWQPVAKHYLVGTLLTNCHTCVYRNETSTYFDVDPPALEEYLG